jgi:phosphoesterase RecJ-like protein
MTEDAFSGEYRRILSLVEESERFLILGHVDADGDCIGSMLAIALFLRGRGKQVACFAPGGLPEIYNNFPGADSFIPEVGLDDFGPDVIFALDTPTLARTSDHLRSCEECRIVNIDHHLTNERFGTIDIIDHEAAAAAVIVYRFLASVAPDEITSEIADCLYLGIMMDTGGFRFQNTSEEALATAAALVGRGARADELAHEFIHMHKYETLQLLALVLESIDILCDGRIAIMEVTREMLEKNGSTMADTEGFVDYASSIDNVLVSAFFREVGLEEVRISLRSRNHYDVAKVAEKYGGGGHRAAAGLTIRQGLTEAKSIIIADLKALIPDCGCN